MTSNGSPSPRSTGTNQRRLHHRIGLVPRAEYEAPALRSVHSTATRTITHLRPAANPRWFVRFSKSRGADDGSSSNISYLQSPYAASEFTATTVSRWRQWRLASPADMRCDRGRFACLC
jgi:hypothetical protein